MDDDNRLGNLRTDLSQLPDDPEGAEEIQASMYHQEINTLKIEKLSNRVTIISVIIPCIIIAIVAFVYLDMKEQVVDVGQTKGTQLEQMAAKLDEKLNALDIRIAEVKYQLEESLPEMEKKRQALENQVAKIASIASEKADARTIQAEVKKLETQIRANAGQDKTTLAAMERINQDLLAAIKENNTQFKSKSEQILQEMQLFKEEFDARLMELSAYEQQIGQLGKSVSLLDKQVKTLKADTEKRVTYRMDQLRLLLEQRLQALENAAAATNAAVPSTPAADAAKAPRPKAPAPETPEDKPVPQLDTGAATGSGIQEKPLTQ